MAALPYVTSPGNIDRALLGIKRAAVPERVSQDFVKTILKIPGGSGAQIASFLKKLGFTNPSDSYKRFRNPAQPGAAVAAVIRHAYRPVATADPVLPDSRLPGPGIWREVRFLDDRIDRARDAGLIMRREARRFSRQANRIAARSYIYGRDGLSASEQAEIESRARAVDSAIGQAAIDKD